MAKTKAVVIPLSVIKSFQPCTDEYRTVAKLWPKGVPLTEETVATFLKNDLSLHWVTSEFLNDLEQQTYRSRRAVESKEYQKKREAIHAKYAEIIDKRSDELRENSILFDKQKYELLLSILREKFTKKTPAKKSPKRKKTTNVR